MEFGIIWMALKDFMFLPCILVIFSIASFWLNILYAKVSVKNIRRGVWEGGDTFRKTGIVLLFVEAIIGGVNPENSCAYIVLFILLVKFLWFFIHQGSCTTSTALGTWSGGQFGPLWRYQCSCQFGVFRRVLEGTAPIGPCGHAGVWGWPFWGCWWRSQGLCIRSMSSFHPGHIPVLASEASCTETCPSKLNFSFPWEIHIFMLQIFKCSWMAKCILRSI